MKQVKAEWIRYNANSKNVSTGDCVKRALSYAFGEDYDSISRELNRIKRDIGSSAYNVPRTFNRFLKDRGAIKFPVTKLERVNGSRMTEEYFCREYPKGIYILLTGPEEKDYSTHMVCIFNGDIIDSWNSSKFLVHEAWEIVNVSTDVEEVTWEDIVPELNEFVSNYVETLNKKNREYFTIQLSAGYSSNPTTYTYKFLLTTFDLPKDCAYRSNQRYIHSIVVKINPRMSAEKNIDSLKPKMKQKLYDYVYPIAKDIKDSIAIQDMEVNESSYKDSWAKKDLLKLPEWCRKYVKYFWINDSSDYYNKYELTLEALPDDPYSTSVHFNADTMQELKQMLERYREDFSRPGREY